MPEYIEEIDTQNRKKNIDKSFSIFAQFSEKTCFIVKIKYRDLGKAQMNILSQNIYKNVNKFFSHDTGFIMRIVAT